MPNMTMHEKADRHIVPAQLICFIITFAAGIVSGFFRPPYIIKIHETFFATGAILLAIKLAREGWDMAAAGYTIFAIGWGVLFAGVDFYGEDVGDHIMSSSGYFFFPSFILIAFYQPFPKWIKIFTLWCAIPFTVNLVLFNINHDNRGLGLWAAIGFGSYHLLSLYWGIFFYRQHKKIKKAQPNNSGNN